MRKPTGRRSSGLGVAVLLLGLAVGALAGCQETSVTTSDNSIREELERLNEQLRRMSTTRKQMAEQVIGLQKELGEVDDTLHQLEAEEVELQYRINRLLGNRVSPPSSGRAIDVFWQWGLAILGVVVSLILFKIRSSRLRDASRLAQMRRMLTQTEAEEPPNEEG